MPGKQDFRRVEALTYRQLDHWTRRGWLHTQDRPAAKAGFPRTWPDEELEVARRMAALISAGLTPEAAHHAARHDGWLPGGTVRVQFEGGPP